MYRLIATDLDGTLLGPDGKAAGNLMEVLTTLCGKGIHFVTASGRMEETQRKIAGEICGLFSTVAYNGSVTVCEDGFRSECFIDAETVKDIAAYACSRGYYVQCYHNGAIRTEKDCPVLRSDPDSRTSEIKFGNLLRDPKPSPKVVVIPEPDAVSSVMSEIREKHPELYVTQSGPYVIEIMPGNTDKSTGLGIICSRLGIDRSEVIAFGDGMNDLPMIEWAGTGVAVANAPDALKNAADKVSAESGPDGVCEILKEVFADIL